MKSGRERSQNPSAHIPSERLLKLQELVKRATIYSKFLSGKIVGKDEVLDQELMDKPQPSILTGATLREYQVVGLKWLISLYENGLNGILADEMGLGKTLQTIALLAHLKEMGTNGPFLVVAPLSTVSNWHAEFKKFTPSIMTICYHGSPPARANIRKVHMKSDPFSAEFPVIITSYDICMNDRKHLANIPWKYIIVDEGHRLKNLDCKLLRDLKSYKSANRLLLTGTPLQNNLSELWSLLNFLMPEIFNDLDAFHEWFEFENDVENIEQSGSASMISSLHDILNPFLLRRRKEEVALDLPKKREYILYAPMLPKQRELYNAILRQELEACLEKNMSQAFSLDIDTFGSQSLPVKRRKKVKYTEVDSSDLSDVDGGQENIDHRSAALKSKKTFIKNLVGRQNLQMTVTQLRKCCNHPYLFHIETENAENPLVHGLPEVVAWSGKMLLLDRLLTALLEKKHKVLIFSQFTSMLNVIEDYLWLIKGLDICRIDGTVALDDRKSEISKFSQANSKYSVFLLSTRAGGLGINLTAADTVIIFDSDWNPQVDLQAQDRVHRIGQLKPVIIYRLITSNSIEKKILEKARAKRTLERLVIHEGKFKGKALNASSLPYNDVTDIQAILEQERASTVSGGVFNEDGENDLLKYIRNPSTVISDKELEAIMDRSEAAFARFEKEKTASRSESFTYSESNSNE